MGWRTHLYIGCSKHASVSEKRRAKRNKVQQETCYTGIYFKDFLQFLIGGIENVWAHCLVVFEVFAS